jgi:hypothetical protein
MSEPTPLCKIAQRNGGDPPLDCLFPGGCQLACAEQEAERKRQEEERQALEGFE